MEENQFDVIVLGTGLVESITAAALSKAGYKVAHIDSNPYYGGDEASLSLEELTQWADAFPNPSSRFQRISRSPDVPSQSRQYSVSLQPAVLPSVGPLISALVASGVSKYSGFRLVDRVSVYDAGRVNNVPGSKEDIFKSKEISLIEKRRLMRFLTFSAGDFEDKKELEGKQDAPFVDFLKSTFSLSDKISSVLAYALAFCASPSEPALSVLQRLRCYLRSAGRYGASPFLLGHYGCLGDISQGFCRAAAVSGAVYILGRPITSIVKAPSSVKQEADQEAATAAEKKAFNYNIVLEDFPDTLECNMLISSPSYVPDTLKADAFQITSPPQADFKWKVASIARCIAIIDQALSLRSQGGETKQEAEPPADVVGGGESESPPTSQPAKDAGVDTGILVFPPSSVDGGSSSHSATALINGEGSLSTPKGKWLVYIGLPLSEDPDQPTTPESLLKPYLDAVLSLSVDQSKIQPLFTTFYLEKPPSPLPNSNVSVAPQPDNRTYIVPAPLPFESLPDLADEATNNAERAFMEVVKALGTTTKREDADGEISFWPPLPRDEEDDDNEW